MKKQILFAMLLAACSPSGEEGVKEKYTDLKKTTEDKGRTYIQSDDVYLCDLGKWSFAGEEAKEKSYRRLCDKDGHPLNTTLQVSKRSYDLVDGRAVLLSVYDDEGNVSTQHKTRLDSSTAELTVYSENKTFDKNGKVKEHNIPMELENETWISHKFCDEKLISEHFISYNGSFSFYLYHNFTLNGKKVNGVLTIEKFESFLDDEKVGVNEESKWNVRVDGVKQMNGYFEILDCDNKPLETFDLKNGKKIEE